MGGNTKRSIFTFFIVLGLVLHQHTSDEKKHNLYNVNMNIDFFKYKTFCFINIMYSNYFYDYCLINNDDWKLNLKSDLAFKVLLKTSWKWYKTFFFIFKYNKLNKNFHCSYIQLHWGTNFKKFFLTIHIRCINNFCAKIHAPSVKVFRMSQS